MFYVEGFIIGKETRVGKEHGRQWSILLPGGPPEYPIPDAGSFAEVRGWVGHIEGVARRIGQYGADGSSSTPTGSRGTGSANPGARASAR